MSGKRRPGRAAPCGIVPRMTIEPKPARRKSRAKASVAGAPASAVDSAPASATAAEAASAAASPSRSPSPSDALPEVVIYADGACSGNPGPGGWGAILISPATGKRIEISGAEPETTNNRMEMTAVLEALGRLKRKSRVRIITDSRYIVDGMNGWIHAWRRNGWKTANRKPVKNRELWEALSAFETRHDLTLEWIRGHQGHPENERCDRMAVEAYQNLVRLRRGPAA